MEPGYANNGAVCHAYPVNNIKIDGDLSEWSKVAEKYPIRIHLSEVKPDNKEDFAAYFQIGYNLDDQSLYIAMEITDDQYIRDTTQRVNWNTKDGVELYLDAQHLPGRSGVASYLYSEDHKHINKAFWDPVANAADWDNIEVVIRRAGNKTIYEWRVLLEGQLKPGRSIGVDFIVFDKDKNGAFTFTAWGKGGYKFRRPDALGDVILMEAHQQPGIITGNIAWEHKMTEDLPGQVRMISMQSADLWVDTEVDSVGVYSVRLPPGVYQLSIPDSLIHIEKKIYQITFQKPIAIEVKAGQKVDGPFLVLTRTLMPDLIPAEGILHTFDESKAGEIDHFIETYQRYYQVPGVSLALIKDRQVVYHKTYGVKNSITGEQIDDNTLFEAASVTKPVFAFAVLSLADQGVIDLDKPLFEYLPFEDIEHDERYKLITARHVLTHQTGFPNWRSMNEDRKLDIKFTPGTQYGYSGEGFEYLKHVIQKITGKDVEQVLLEEVIEPLGLYHIHFSKNDTVERLVSDGHIDNLPTGYGIPQNPNMAASMHIESKAFTRFMLALLNQERLKPSTYEDMLRQHSEYNYDNEEEKPDYKEYMGLSLAIRESTYGLVFGHGGNNGDFRCGFEVYKDVEMGYVMFTNANTAYPFLEMLPAFLVEGKQAR